MIKCAPRKEIVHGARADDRTEAPQVLRAYKGTHRDLPRLGQQREMPRQAKVEFVSLKSSLVNLPVSLFGPLLERNIASPSLSSSVLYID